MRYLEVISKTKYGRLNIIHSILQDWDTILSFEDWVFKIYSKDYLKDRNIQKVVIIPNFDLNQYKGLRLPLNCYEAIEHIYKLEWLNMNTWRLKNYLLLFLWTTIVLLFWIWYGVQLPSETQDAIITFIRDNNILYNY